MGIFDFLKEKKSVPPIDAIHEATREGLPKAYIPKFIYKPPFGFPRFVDLPMIRRLAAMPFVEMCLVPETEIYLGEGETKEIQNIQIGDKVLTHNSKFQKVNKLMSREINEDMYLIKTYYSNEEIKITKNHPFFIFRDNKKQWVDAENLNKEDKILFPIDKKICDLDLINIEKSINLIDKEGKRDNKGKFVEEHFGKKSKLIGDVKVSASLMRIIGSYIAEGCCDKRSVLFGFGESEEQIANQIVKDVKEVFHLEAKIKKRDSVIEVKIHNSNLTKFFKDNFGDYGANKRLPNWVFRLPNEKIKYLLRNYFKGDGFDSFSKVGCDSISKQLILQIRDILLRFKILCSYREISRDSVVILGRKVNANNLFHLGITGIDRIYFKQLIFNEEIKEKSYRKFGDIDEDYVYLKVKEIKKEKYKGKVYNFEVDKDNSYCTKYCCLHNCISTIVDEASAVPWDIVVKEGIEPTPEHEEQIKHVKSFYENPNTNKESFDEIRRKYIRDILEVDAGVLIKMFNLKEEMVEIMARDGSTFTKNPDIFGRIVDRDDIIIDPNIATTNKEMVLMEPGWITAADAREKAAYFQYGWISGARPVPFGKKEIVWFERNPRTDNIYGRSPIEVLAQSIQTLIYAIEHNLEYFSNNSIPAGIVGLEGADTDAIKAFKDQWEEQQRVKDSAGNWKKKFHHVPIVGKTPTFTRLQFTNAELELIESQKWWAKMVWACYSDDIEILTEEGFKLFKDLNDEKVARVNPENLEIDFVKPVDKQEYDFDGELINYKTKSCDLLVTPEHKMLMCDINKFYDGNLKWESKEAKDFNKGIIPQAGNFKGENIEKVKFGNLEIEGDDFCKFMGIWLSDGWVESANNRVCLCASQVYPENMKFINDLLEKINVDYKIKVSEPNAIIQGKKVNINGMMNYYRFSNPEFHDYLIQFGKAKEKFVPKIIRNSSKEQRELFLDAFMLGDGSRGYKGKNDRYGSMSKNLLDGLQEMLIKNGKSATLFQNSFNGCWELTVRKTKTEKIKQKYYSRIVKENVSKQKYKGKVYDVTVPENHFLVVRRNGRVSISGNCFGVTSTELGYTEDAKGLANQIVQSNVFRKRAINPILKIEAYKHNHEIIPEFYINEKNKFVIEETKRLEKKGIVEIKAIEEAELKAEEKLKQGKFPYQDIEFKFLMFDVEEETKKASLYKIQLDAGYKSINEIRQEEGMDDVEWGDKMSEQERHEMNNEFGDPFEKEKNDLENQSKFQSRTDKIDKKKDNEEKAIDNPLILREFEVMDDDRLEKSIVYLMKENEKKIKDLIEKEIGSNQLINIKSIDDVAKRIKELVSFMGLKTISDAVIRNTFMSGWDSAEKQLNQNMMVNKEAINYIQEYTFNNIKSMTEEIATDLRQELERGIMSGEGITKIKARVSKVFDVGENRAEAIARTEVARSEAMGKDIAIKKSGEKFKKKIVIAHDDRTSALCKRLEGQTVGLYEKFKDKTTGGEWDLNPFHVNCRSVVIYLSEDE